MWGASFPAARYLLRPDAGGAAALSPLILAALRFGIASAVFAVPLAVALRRRPLPVRSVVQLALLGQLGFALYFWLQYVGVQKTNASLSSIVILGLIPLFTAVFAWLGRLERFSWAQVFALLLGAAGIVLLGQARGITTEGRDLTVGLTALVVNAACFALYALLARQWVQRTSPVIVSGVAMTGGTVGLLLLTLTDLSGWRAVAVLGAGEWLAVLYLALLCSVAAYFLFNYALTVVPASQAAFLALFEPVVAIAIGATLLGERLGWMMAAGAVLILAAVLLVLRRQRG